MNQLFAVFAYTITTAILTAWNLKWHELRQARKRDVKSDIEKNIYYGEKIYAILFCHIGCH